MEHRVKIKKIEKIDKYLNLAKNEEKKKIVQYVNVYDTNLIMFARNGQQYLLKGLDQLEIERGIETIQTRGWLTSTRVQRKVMETWEDLQSLKNQTRYTNVNWCEQIVRSKIIKMLLLLLLFSPLEFFTSVLANGFSLESEWLQVFWSLQDLSQDSGSSQQCCHLDSFYPSANFQVLQAF